VSVQDGGTLVLGGALSGANGIEKYGLGLVLFTQSNSYTGVTTVRAGTLAISNSGALGSAAVGNVTTVVSGATLEVRGTINTGETVAIAGAGLNGVGSLYNGTGNNVVQNVNLTADAMIGVATGTFLLIPSTLGQSGGTGFNLTKSGAGVLDVLATATYTGSTTVAAGTLAVEGTVNGAIAVNAGATIAGAGGNLGDVTSTGGIVNPGFSTSPFASDAASLTLDAASTFVARLNGNTPGNGTTGYSQMNASVSSLGGATLSLTIGGGYTPVPGDSLAIITNVTGISGRFNGLPEGAYVSLGAGRTFKITYQGGSGSDVVLRYVDDTSTTLTSSSNPSSPGQSVTLTATVAPIRVGGPTPTGTVTFKDGATTLGTGTLVNGVATFSTAALTTGSHTLTSVFDGDFATAPSTSASLTQVVGQVATATTLTSSADPSVFGQSVTFTATVENTSGGGVPTGSVEFFDGATSLGAGSTPGGAGTRATSTFTTSTLTAGSHSISAVYTATGSFQDSTSSILTQDVNQAPLTITADDQSKAYGAALPTLTASYSGFVNGDTPSSLDTLPTLSTSASAASHVAGSPYAITAGGAAGSNYSISYVAGNLTVTAVTLTASADDLSRLQGEANPPLTYTLSGFVNGDSTSVVSGTPTLSTTATINSPDGQYPIDITVGTLIAADYDFTTVDGTLTVANTPITLSPTTLPMATVGDAYSQHLTASGGSGTGYSFAATGLPAGLSLATTGLLSGTPATAIGSPFLVDVSVTDGDGSTGSRTYTLSVGKSQAISGDVDASAPQVYFGQEVTLTATFTANSDGQTPMTGTVDFFDGDTYLGTAPLIAGPSGLRVASLVSSPLTAATSGQARLTTSALAAGNHVIRAVYSGDANFAASSSSTLVSVLVLQATSSVALTVAVSGSSATLTANVIATSPGQPVLVGNVLFYDGDTLVGTRPLVDGVATLGPAGLSAGSHSFRAVFAGNADSAASGSSVVSTVVEGGGTATTVVGLAWFGFRARPTTLVVSFSGALDPAVASNRANYVITGPLGRRLRFGRRVAVRSAAYDDASNSVTLSFNRRLNLQKTYRIAIAGSNYVGPLGGEILARATR